MILVLPLRAKRVSLYFFLLFFHVVTFQICCGSLTACPFLILHLLQTTRQSQGAQFPYVVLTDGYSKILVILLSLPDSLFSVSEHTVWDVVKRSQLLLGYVEVANHPNISVAFHPKVYRDACGLLIILVLPHLCLHSEMQAEKVAPMWGEEQEPNHVMTHSDVVPWLLLMYHWS